MNYIALKNISNSPFVDMYDGKEYEFTPGQVRILAEVITEHFRTHARLGASGGKVFDILPEDRIPEGIFPEIYLPSSGEGSVLLENIGDKNLEMMYDGVAYNFKAKSLGPCPITLVRVMTERSYDRATKSYLLVLSKNKANESIPQGSDERPVGVNPDAVESIVAEPVKQAGRRWGKRK